MESRETKRHTTYRNSKMADVNPTLSAIILTVNGLNTPVKRQRPSQLITKTCSNWLKGKGLEKIYHANSNQKRAGVPTLITDK